MSTMVLTDHAVNKDMTEATSSVDTVGFSTTVIDVMEPSTSISMNSMTLSTTTLSTTTTVDTKALSIQVKHYLKSNQIKWNRFSTLVLGVSQSRLSTLLNNPEPFNSLTRRVQALYERMDLWMRTRATYGNNPYSKDKIVSQCKGKKYKQGKVPASKKKPRSLLDGDENIEILEALKEYNNAKNLLLVGSGELDLSDAEVVSSKRGHDGDTTLQKVVEEYVMTMDSTDYENYEVLTTQEAIIQEGEVSIKASPDGENEVNYQMGWQVVNEGPLQVFMVEYPEGIKDEKIVCEEGNPKKPGSCKHSLQGAGHD